MCVYAETQILHLRAFSQGLDPMQLEADLELRLRHLGAGGYAANAGAAGGCAAAQLVQLPGKAHGGSITD